MVGPMCCLLTTPWPHVCVELTVLPRVCAAKLRDGGHVEANTLSTQTRPVRPRTYGGVGTSYGGVWGLNSLGFEGPRAVNGASG